MPSRQLCQWQTYLDSRLSLSAALCAESGTVPSRQLCQWQTYLDSRLPPPLLGVAQWVNKAETLLAEAEEPALTPPAVSGGRLVTVILEEHTVLVESPAAPPLLAHN